MPNVGPRRVHGGAIIATIVDLLLNQLGTKPQVAMWPHGAGDWDSNILLQPKTSRRRRRRLRGKAKETRRVA